MNKKIASFLLAFVFTATFFALPASASTVAPSDYNMEVTAFAQNLEKKYNIEINFPTKKDGYFAVGTATLSTLGKTLSYITPTVISQLSDYCYKKTGKYLSINYIYIPASLEDADVNALGKTSLDSSTVELFIPGFSSNMTQSGSSPIVIAHEIGHVFESYIADTMGYSQFKEDWSAFNSGFSYSQSYTKNPDQNTFASVYSTVSFEEDFAETFSYAFISNRAGLGLSKRLYKPNGSFTNFGNKVDYLNKIMPKHVKNAKMATGNIHKSKTVPVSINYQEASLSGNSLEYIGFSQPHGIYSNILNSLKIEEKSSEWVFEVGGWKVTDIKGGIYLVFPGSTFVTLKLPPHNKKTK